MKKALALLVVASFITNNLEASMSSLTRPASAISLAAAAQSAPKDSVAQQLAQASRVQLDLELLLTCPTDDKNAQDACRKTMQTLTENQKTIVDFFYYKVNKTPGDIAAFKKLLAALSSRPHSKDPKVDAELQAMDDKRIESSLTTQDIPLTSITNLSLAVTPSPDQNNVTLTLKADVIAPATTNQILALTSSLLTGILFDELNQAQSANKQKFMEIKKYALSLAKEQSKA